MEELPATPRLRLRKQDKFTLKSDFDYMREHGRKLAGRWFLLVLAASPEGALKCGVIASRKYSLNAVVRNRARRLFTESFRRLKPQIAPCRLLMIPRRAMMDADCGTIMKELERLLRQGGVWRDGSPRAADSSASSGSIN